jgi:hypothetical protein
MDFFNQKRGVGLDDVKEDGDETHDSLDDGHDDNLVAPPGSVNHELQPANLNQLAQWMASPSNYGRPRRPK